MSEKCKLKLQVSDLHTTAASKTYGLCMHVKIFQFYCNSSQQSFLTNSVTAQNDPDLTNKWSKILKICSTVFWHIGTQIMCGKFRENHRKTAGRAAIGKKIFANNYKIKFSKICLQFLSAHRSCVPSFVRIEKKLGGVAIWKKSDDTQTSRHQVSK